MNKMNKTRSPWRALALVLGASLALGGCATSSNPKDPLEKFNRSMFTFNDGVDRVVLKPAATAYKEVLPGFMQTGVSNFFGNLSDVWTGANNLMQGKGAAGMSDLTRVALNSTFGLGGLLDIASEAGLQKHNEDFGQTLGYWGVPSGPYVMLPIFGPSTVRDTAVMRIDVMADPWAYVYPVNVRNVGTAVRAVEQRAAVLDASNLMEEAALDRYQFIRDGYLQRRQSKIFDGEGSRKELRAQDKLEAAADKAADAAPAVAKAVDKDLPSDAAAIRAAYADDPEPAAAAPAAPAVSAPVSSETPVK
ncbi:VacJ family lipoprotein [Massilia glaciei]|uniref:VacJ family lipoprotein n=2 Tax=Massilia glaciei TaxID=1524097 RepID=A0A2U2HDP8_9BURK|nr:VacJ family lipoprotein [Massilia glaciei]PWF41244.1 VacJ family lipoprotein [Massilia glaciei]